MKGVRAWDRLMGIARKESEGARGEPPLTGAASRGIVTAWRCEGPYELWREWKPELVLMDVHMPVMNGHEATGEQLRL